MFIIIFSTNFSQQQMFTFRIFRSMSILNRKIDDSGFAGYVIYIHILQVHQNMTQLIMENGEYQQQQHKKEVKSAFVNYARDMRQENACLYQPISNNSYYRHNQQRKALMMEEALRHNQIFLNQLIDYVNYTDDIQQFTPNQQTTRNNRSKIKTTVKQFYREWCEQSKEKDDYTKIVDKCKNYLKNDDVILVPGCGLGRLVFELVRAGFGAQGNQVTYFMLYGSNFIMNCTQRKQQFKIYPFIHSMSYYYDEEDIFRSVNVPDVAVVDHVQEDANFGIVAGQFCEIYRERGENFHAVASCFFIDTANNIFAYVDTIYHTLKQAGIWVNFGPLLFHYRQLLNQISIEISWQALRQYIAQSFDFIQEWFQETTYCHDPKSEMTVTYNCIGFVCRKKKNQ